ncbi:MAG: hypothetical protein ACK52I_23215, partial [Pseudomonadota bacterium]
IDLCIRENEQKIKDEKATNGLQRVRHLSRFWLVWKPNIANFSKNKTLPGIIRGGLHLRKN